MRWCTLVRFHLRGTTINGHADMPQAWYAEPDEMTLVEPGAVDFLKFGIVFRP